MDEFFAEDQVVVQKKKKFKKLKDGKAAKIKRRKKEVTLHFLTVGWGSSAVVQRQQLRVLPANTSWVSVDGKKGEQVLSQPWKVTPSCPAWLFRSGNVP